MFATRLTGILKALQTTLGNYVTRHDLHGPLLVLVWNRLGRTCLRFERLVAQWRAGTLAACRPSRAGQPRARKAEALRLPTNRTWLIDLTRGPAAAAAFRLRVLMNDAELRQFLAECPRAGRVLRPLAQMLGISLGEPEFALLRRPPRVRKPRPPKPPRPESRTALLRRLRAMTGAELKAWFHPMPPHFNLPIPGWRAIRRKIAAA